MNLIFRNRHWLRENFSAAATSAVTLLLMSLGCGGIALAAHHSVAPNQDFSTDILQVHAPGTRGWHISSQGVEHIAFARQGSTGDESYIAAANLVQLPRFTTPDAFKDYIKQAVANESPPDRFETIESSIEESSERPYPCIKYHGVSTDLHAQISRFQTEKLRLEIIALYCQHPTRPGVGFGAMFSHRGGTAEANFSSEAAAFIASVQANTAAKAP